MKEVEKEEKDEETNNVSIASDSLSKVSLLQPRRDELGGISLWSSRAARVYCRCNSHGEILAFTGSRGPRTKINRSSFYFFPTPVIL